jgi:hypothetical protein
MLTPLICEELNMTTTGDKGSSAGAKHGSKEGSTAPIGLNENSGEFRIGEKITFGVRNGNVMLRRSPQGEEVEVSEATLAGLMIDAFFTDKFKNQYPTVKGNIG